MSEVLYEAIGSKMIDGLDEIWFKKTIYVRKLFNLATTEEAFMKEKKKVFIYVYWPCYVNIFQEKR